MESSSNNKPPRPDVSPFSPQTDSARLVKAPSRKSQRRLSETDRNQSPKREMKTSQDSVEANSSEAKSTVDKTKSDGQSNHSKGERKHTRQKAMDFVTRTVESTKQILPSRGTTEKPKTDNYGAKAVAYMTMPTQIDVSGLQFFELENPSGDPYSSGAFFTTPFKSARKKKDKRAYKIYESLQKSSHACAKALENAGKEIKHLVKLIRKFANELTSLEFFIDPNDPRCLLFAKALMSFSEFLRSLYDVDSMALPFVGYSRFLHLIIESHFSNYVNSSSFFDAMSSGNDTLVPPTSTTKSPSNATTSRSIASSAARSNVTLEKSIISETSEQSPGSTEVEEISEVPGLEEDKYIEEVTAHLLEMRSFGMHLDTQCKQQSKRALAFVDSLQQPFEELFFSDDSDTIGNDDITREKIHPDPTPCSIDIFSMDVAAHVKKPVAGHMSVVLKDSNIMKLADDVILVGDNRRGKSFCEKKYKKYNVRNRVLPQTLIEYMILFPKLYPLKNGLLNGVRTMNQRIADLTEEGENGPQTIVIRGTDFTNMKHILLDFDTYLEEEPKFGAKVHRGFRRGALELLEDVRPFLDINKPVSLVGHSLGATVAQLVALYLKLEGFKIDSVIGFGAPRMTDKENGQILEEQLPEVLRVSCYKDPVRAMPKGKKFKHFGKSLLFFEDGSCFYYPTASQSDRILFGSASKTLSQHRTGFYHFNIANIAGQCLRLPNLVDQQCEKCLNNEMMVAVCGCKRGEQVTEEIMVAVDSNDVEKVNEVLRKLV